ncbi:kinase-like domain-containing protein [Mycena vulgaris]|nr:kinase-like domain-containing protein [Mycena vulgaris]
MSLGWRLARGPSKALQFSLSQSRFHLHTRLASSFTCLRMAAPESAQVPPTHWKNQAWTISPNSERINWTEHPHAGTALSPVPLTANQHWSVDPEGKRVVDFSFVEEPLGMPAEIGYGFAHFEFGELVGPEGRYKVARKLGWGMNSSTWLVYDLPSQEYLALKVLTGRCTLAQSVENAMGWERQALQRVSETPSAHCLQLRNSFMIPGKGSAGAHLCLATPVLAGDVRSAWNKARLSVPLAKRVLLHTLRGLAHAHKCGVVHTDLKPDNTFIGNVLSTPEINGLLEADPARRHEVEASFDGLLQNAVSQPIPGPSMEEEGMTRSYVLGDFGSAQPIGKPRTDHITPVSLRPPEIWLGGPWNEKVDIWTFGCLVYEFVSGNRLFVHEPKTVEGVALDATESILHQMTCLTQEDFKPEVLQVSRHAEQWFDSTCNLRKLPPLYNYLFDNRLECAGIGRGDAVAVGALLQRCMRLDHADRVSAEELLSDPWFDGA